jgi:hypothetical protein
MLILVLSGPLDARCVVKVLEMSELDLNGRC